MPGDIVRLSQIKTLLGDLCRPTQISGICICPGGGGGFAELVEAKLRGSSVERFAMEAVLRKLVQNPWLGHGLPNLHSIFGGHPPIYQPCPPKNPLSNEAVSPRPTTEKTGGAYTAVENLAKIGIGVSTTYIAAKGISQMLNLFGPVGKTAASIIITIALPNIVSGQEAHANTAGAKGRKMRYVTNEQEKSENSFLSCVVESAGKVFTGLLDLLTSPFSGN